MERTYSDLEKEQMMMESKNKQQQKYTRGRRIVTAICVINVVMAIISFFYSWNIISLAIQIGLNMALYCGVTWVRYFFAVGAGLGVIATMYLLCTTIGNLVLTIYCILMGIYCLVSAVILLKSEVVSEFMYVQKNG